MATRSITFQEIAAQYAVDNDINQVRQLLVSEGLIASMDIANTMSARQLVSLLLTYYINNGPDAYGMLLRKFTPNRATTNYTTNLTILNGASNDFTRLMGSNGSMAKTSFGDVISTFWEGLVSSSSSASTPVVTQSTSTSPVVVAYVIGGVLVLAVLAYVVLKS